MIIRSCILVVSLVLSAQAFANDYPDTTGTWKATLDGVKLQKNLGSAEHNVNHTPAETGVYQGRELTMEIGGQDGFSFSGTKRSANAEEAFAGIFLHDNSHFKIIDFDGHSDCTVISTTEIRCDYVEINPVNSNLNRQVWIRE